MWAADATPSAADAAPSAADAAPSAAAGTIVFAGGIFRDIVACAPRFPKAGPSLSVPPAWQPGYSIDSAENT